MRLHIITIVLDGMPFITWHYPILRQLKLDWHWHVVEGVALPEKDTGWCTQLEPRLSRDGTHEYLTSLANFDKRVHYFVRTAWPGKTAMFNHALSVIEDQEFLLMQIDSDEIWTREQIEKIHDHFSLCRFKGDSRHTCAFFHCRYFVGPELVITSRNGFGNYNAYEWKRVWLVTGGIKFKSHEPPVLENFEEVALTQEQTERAGLVFDHFAYSTEAQMRFKEHYYNSPRNPNGHLYANAAANWRRLQSAPMPLAQLNQFFPWVGEGVTVERVKL